MTTCAGCGLELELVRDDEEGLDYYTCSGCRAEEQADPYWQHAGVSLYLGDCLKRMTPMPKHSVDAVVTDPPYGLKFMGKEWDREQSHQAWAVEALRVLKPGGHLLAFGGTRTHHRLWCALEDAGFEIRDTLMWLYGSGFPKGKAQLKPAWEPIVLARKPLAGMMAANVKEHGTGALNIDGCRIGTDNVERTIRGGGKNTEQWRMGKGSRTTGSSAGRWPANLVLDEEAAKMLDAQSGERPSGSGNKNIRSRGGGNAYGAGLGRGIGDGIGGDSGGASRFFYCAKASRKEREAGVSGEERPLHWSSGDKNPGSFQSEGTKKSSRNAHPTVKPLALMRWLVRLVTPPSGLILDPFLGSGTTAIAATAEGFRCIGIDNNEEYLAIAVQRLEDL